MTNDEWIAEAVSGFQSKVGIDIGRGMPERIKWAICGSWLGTSLQKWPFENLEAKVLNISWRTKLFVPIRRWALRLLHRSLMGLEKIRARGVLHFQFPAGWRTRVLAGRG